jgi:hypothetical protein
MGEEATYSYVIGFNQFDIDINIYVHDCKYTASFSGRENLNSIAALYKSHTPIFREWLTKKKDFYEGSDTLNKQFASQVEQNVEAGFRSYVK